MLFLCKPVEFLVVSVQIAIQPLLACGHHQFENTLTSGALSGEAQCRRDVAFSHILINRANPTFKTVLPSKRIMCLRENLHERTSMTADAEAFSYRTLTLRRQAGNNHAEKLKIGQRF